MSKMLSSLSRINIFYLQACREDSVDSLTNDDKSKKLIVPLLHDATKLAKLVPMFPTAELVVGENEPNHVTILN